MARYAAEADIEDRESGAVLRCHLRANLGDLAPGDRVQWQRNERGAGVVSGVLPRTSEFRRPDKFGNVRLVAANITRACITLAKAPAPHASLLDRYLVVAEHFEFEPLLVLNKSDLLAPGDPIGELLQIYKDLGYDSCTVSAECAAGLEELQSYLQEGISLFVGQSGVGKSSLLQRLLPDEVLRVGALSEQVAKGRHTTTQARLYHFPGGGSCIDSPGIREFGLWHLTQPQIAAGFCEFRPHLGQCRFRDCRHVKEPSCTILAAVEAGEIRTDRHASYCAMLTETGRE